MMPKFDPPADSGQLTPEDALVYAAYIVRGVAYGSDPLARSLSPKGKELLILIRDKLLPDVIKVMDDLMAKPESAADRRYREVMELAKGAVAASASDPTVLTRFMAEYNEEMKGFLGDLDPENLPTA